MKSFRHFREERNEQVQQTLCELTSGFKLEMCYWGESGQQHFIRVIQGRSTPDVSRRSPRWSYRSVSDKKKTLCQQERTQVNKKVLRAEGVEREREGFTCSSSILQALRMDQ